MKKGRKLRKEKHWREADESLQGKGIFRKNLRWLSKWNKEPQQLPKHFLEKRYKSWSLKVRLWWRASNHIRTCRTSLLFKQALLTISNVKYVCFVEYLKHHEYWADFQGHIFKALLSPICWKPYLLLYLWGQCPRERSFPLWDLFISVASLSLSLHICIFWYWTHVFDEASNYAFLCNREILKMYFNKLMRAEI